MPKLQVPEPYRSSIASLADLSDKQVDVLAQALRTASKTKAADIAASVDPPIPHAEQLVEAILPLYSVPEEFGVTLQQFIDDVVDAIRPEWSERTEDDAPQAEARFRERLVALTSVAEFSTLTKALSVLASYERPFQSARVFTDLRPVFADEVTNGVVGMGVVHNLKLTYVGPEHGFQDFYIALTTNDLRKLKDVLERADAKAAQLRQQLVVTGVRYLEGE